MRVVVVGATGNVGTAVLERLHAAAEVTEIVGIARRIPEQTGAYADVSWHAIDVAEPAAVRRLTLAFSGADAVVTVAWLLQPNHRERVLAATNVQGLAHTLTAVLRAGVPQVVVASSVGAYSPGPKNRRVTESWPTGGIHTSHYSRQKAVTERMLDAFEAEHPEIVVTRIRPGVVGQERSGAEQKRLFVAPLPLAWLSRVRLPLVPLPNRAIAQVVHADDLADAFWRVLDRRAAGAFNIATEPIVTPATVAGVLGGRVLPVRVGPVRALLLLAWRLHLVRADPGWLDIATTVPLMSTDRARTELGWTPRVPAEEVLRTAVDAVAGRGEDAASPKLRR